MSQMTIAAHSTADDGPHEPDAPIFEGLVRTWSENGRLVPGDDREWNTARLQLMLAVPPAAPDKDPTTAELGLGRG